MCPIQQKLFASYDTGSSKRLSDLCFDLLEQQKAAWSQLHEAYAALDSLRVRDLHCDGFSVRLQFNSQRLVSSGAAVDEKSIGARPCFLCLENLPAAQMGVLYQEEFLVLCNPAPIFAQHYTISKLAHVPQAIEEYAATFLALAKDFSPYFSVFYNGPKCGASAPDHVHFQAAPAGTMPVERELQDKNRRELFKNVDGVAVLRAKNLGREVIVLEGNDPNAVGALLLRCMAAMKRVALATAEPMLNILASYLGGVWRLIIFPRRKHRPDVYSRGGDDRILISPAAVDLGGLFITPIEKDFLALDARLVEDIYQEVSIDKKAAHRILSAL